MTRMLWTVLWSRTDYRLHALYSFGAVLFLAVHWPHWIAVSYTVLAVGFLREVLQHSGARLQRQWPWLRRFAFLRGEGDWGDLAANALGAMSAAAWLAAHGVPR